MHSFWGIFLKVFNKFHFGFLEKMNFLVYYIKFCVYIYKGHTSVMLEYNPGNIIVSQLLQLHALKAAYSVVLYYING